MTTQVGDLIRRFAVLATVLAVFCPSAAAADGRIEGRVTRPGGSGVPGVAVVLGALGLTAITDPNGTFSFESVPAGAHDVVFSLADNQVARDGVTVTDAATTRLDQVVDWTLRYTDTITVFGASRFTERLVEAPASVSIVGQERVELEASQGQLPRLLQSVPGADVTQSGVYDFNLNVRGFNTVLNRRLLVLIDGRDPGGVLLGAQEWSGYGLVTDDLTRVEFIRGPGSALYGSNG